MSKRFVHLHTHTEYSMLDGAARISELVEIAKKDGQGAIAITDHGNMYGVIDFYKKCKEADIKPIIGLEAYMASGSRYDKPTRKSLSADDTGGEDDKGQKLYYHLTLLALNQEGYHNLVKISSEAFLSGYYYKPRVDFELLETYKNGILATSGCLGGLVLQELLKGNEEKATEILGQFKDIFGSQNFFVEIQDHGLKEQKMTNPSLIKLAKKVGLPLVATNDSHYCKKEDARFHDALLCVQTGKNISDENRLKFHGSEHYLKSSEEMWSLFQDIPEALYSTTEIAERANVSLELGRSVLPRYEVPKEFVKGDYEARVKSYLEHKVYEGAKKRYGQRFSKEIKERIEYELSVINDMGFAAYFLVVEDFVNYAKSRGIRVGPGRGSAAGSVVAYALSIVDLDPISYDLIFERFLNPGRKQLPDIDIDFDERYRSEVINYVANRYGKDKVAQIITFSMIRARAAIRDSARILGYPYSLGDKIAKLIPPIIRGRETPLWACFKKTDEYSLGYEQAQELRDLYENDPDARKVVDIAMGLEGLTRQDGIHAAAVVISDKELTQYLPVQRKPEPGSDPKDAPVVTQFDMAGIEALGLLKIDFLGLRNLSVIDETVTMLKKTRGLELDLDKIPYDDKKTFEMLKSGDCLGVFQLESPMMRQLVKTVSPDSFKEIADIVALGRPGPMDSNVHISYERRKHKKEPITYIHPDMKDILDDTYGLMIYQESMMRIAQKFAGYSLKEADDLRKACGKKIRSLIQEHREKFIEGCVNNGYEKEVGEKLFDLIEPFADYGFNKSHSYGYGLISYQTAYLKANYTPEYMACLLTSVKDNQEQMAMYLADCKLHSISIMPPNVNASGSGFTPIITENNKAQILVGISAIRNVGESIAQKIILEREKNGEFKSFNDFVSRVDLSVLNKRAIESLIKAGAFDGLGHTRKGLFEKYDQIIDIVLRKKKDREAGVVSLFDSRPASDVFENDLLKGATDEFDLNVLRGFEKEMIGHYISDHPLKEKYDILLTHIDIGLGALLQEAEKMQNGQESYDEIIQKSELTLGGVITDLNLKKTKKGDAMATFTLEEIGASIPAIVFPKAFKRLSGYLKPDQVIFAKGRLDFKDSPPNLVVQDVFPVEISNLNPKQSGSLAIEIPVGCDIKVLEGLKLVLKNHPGDANVILKVGNTYKSLPRCFRVQLSEELLAEVKAIIGEGVLLNS